MKKINLFCVPHAGGSATLYNGWKNEISENIILNPLELSGRGKRFGSPLYEHFEDAVSDLYNMIEYSIKEGDYVLYGHSMGGVMVFDLLNKLIEEKKPLPVHVFISGSCPPHLKFTRKKTIHLLNDEELIAEINQYGGISEEVLNCRELLDIIIPTIRGDYKILENRKLTEHYTPFDINLTILGGRDDSEVYEEELEQWRGYTNKNFQLKMFEGGHFFINSEKESVLELINKTLESYLKE